MHVTPTELRSLRQDGILIRFALLDSMAFILAEIPATGSAGTSLETPCTRPHWGFVLSGEIEFETEGRRQAIAAGSAFHVRAGGPAHRFHTTGSARVAGFEPIDPVVDTSDAALTAHGFELVGPDAAGAATVVPPSFASLLDPKRIEVRTWAMSSLVLTQTRFGPTSGYTSNWCDAPHWGLVTEGRLAIEFEDDIEILGAGDVYHCPAGPPGHRIEAADPASIVDLTPLDALAGPGRISLWRRQASERLHPGEAGEIAVAGLG
jgi:quercetin dioxygenase-like cupin family protein